MTPEDGVSPRGAVVSRYPGALPDEKHPITGFSPQHPGPWGEEEGQQGTRWGVPVPPASHPLSGIRKVPGRQVSRCCTCVDLPQGGAPGTTRNLDVPPVKEKEYDCHLFTARGNVLDAADHS